MRVSLVGALAWLLLAPELRAAEVTHLPNGNVSISARGTPLGTVLRQFSAIAPLDTSLIDPKIERSQVDLALQDVPLPAALAAAFESAGVSFVVWGSDPTNLRIVAFAQGSATADGAHAGQAKAIAPQPLPEQGYVLPNGVVLPPGISPDDPDVAMLGGPPPPREIPPEDDPELAEALTVLDPNSSPPPGYDPAYADILGPPPAPPENDRKP